MAKAYILVTEAIHDPEGMKAYGAKAAQAMGDARVLAVDSTPEVLEGAPPGGRAVLLEFATPEAAKAWYTSPEYQAAIPLRQAAADSTALLITGL
jgi:uncharacterized protein (DUF1330 family)